MKTPQVLFLLLLATVGTGLLQAEPILLPDPDMALDEAIAGSIPLTSTVFSITANANGGGVLPLNDTFLNATGQDWLTLEVTTPLAYASYAFACYGGPFFASCSVTPHPVTGNAIFRFYQAGGIFFDVLTDGSGIPLFPTQPSPAEHYSSGASHRHFYPGIVNGGEFNFNLNGGVDGLPIDTPGTNGKGGWLDEQGQPLTLIVAANVPEPSFQWLALGTLGALGLARRRYRS